MSVRQEVGLSSSSACLPGSRALSPPFFSRFGHLNSQTRAQGDLITLSQSDKWLRQAKVIDGWNVTTTDTAIAFRKISRGSLDLSFSSWLQFLQELGRRKGLCSQEVRRGKEQKKPLICLQLVDRLGMCAAPTSSYSAENSQL